MPCTLSEAGPCQHVLCDCQSSTCRWDVFEGQSFKNINTWLQFRLTDCNQCLKVCSSVVSHWVSEWTSFWSRLLIDMLQLNISLGSVLMLWRCFAYDLVKFRPTWRAAQSAGYQISSLCFCKPQIHLRYIQTCHITFTLQAHRVTITSEGVFCVHLRAWSQRPKQVVFLNQTLICLFVLLTLTEWL